MSPDLPTDAGESTPGQTILSFQVHARQGLPVRHGDCWSHRRTSTRTSQPDNLTFQSPMLGKAYPSGTAIVEATVGCRRELPSQTTHPFRLLAPRYRTPSNATCPAVQAILSFQSTTGEVQPSDFRVLISRRTPQEPPGWTTSHFPPTSASGMSAKHPDQNFTFPSSPVRRSESWSPIGRRRELPGQASLPFLVPRWRRLPVQHSGYCAPVGRRREPHSETTYRFPLGRRD